MFDLNPIIGVNKVRMWRVCMPPRVLNILNMSLQMLTNMGIKAPKFEKAHFVGGKMKKKALK